MKSFSLNVVLVLHLFSFYSNVKGRLNVLVCKLKFKWIFIVGAINCYSCDLTKGWLMNSDGTSDGTWGVDECNNFSQNMTAYYSARNCSSGISTNDPEPTHCYTTFESTWGQADFSGVKEARGCDSAESVSRGNFSIWSQLKSGHYLFYIS